MQHQGFIQAIADDPDNDVHRLVYADWLDDNGDPERAEFIRLECELFPLLVDENTAPNHWDCPRYYELQEKIAPLYEVNYDEWFSPLFDELDSEMETQRGFPHSVSLSGRQFAERAVELFEQEPTVEQVLIYDLDGYVPEIAASPALASVRDLQFFETPILAPDMEQFAKSPHLGNMRRLSFAFTDAPSGPDGAKAIANAEALTRLEKLDLLNHHIRDEGAIALFQSPRLATLKTLNLGVNQLYLQSMQELTKAEHLCLESLDVSSNQLQSDSIAALAQAENLRQLKVLDIGANLLERDGAIELANAEFLPSLRELGLSNCRFDDESLAIVLHAEMHDLIKLHAGNNSFGRLTSEALAQNHSLKQVRTLGLYQGRFESGLNFENVNLPALRELALWGSEFESGAKIDLLSSELLQSLHDLGLANCEVSDDEIEVLAKNDAIRNLLSLTLRDNVITDRGAIALVESPHLDQIQSLDLQHNSICNKGVVALRDRFGSRVNV